MKYDPAVPGGTRRSYEDDESRPGDLNTGFVAGLNEKRLRVRKRQFPFGFSAPVRHAHSRNRHTISVPRRG